MLFSSKKFKIKQLNRGLSTATTLVAIAVVAIIGITAYVQWGEGGAGSAPAIDDVIAAHQSVESFQHNTALALDMQLDPAALEKRSDAQQLRQFMQYVPNVSADEFPGNLTAELGISGSVAMGSEASGNADTNIRVSVGSDQLSDVLDVEWKKVDNQQFLRAQTLPDIGFFALSQFEDQWYSASSTATDQLGQAGLTDQLPSGVSSDTEVSATTSRKLVQAMVDEGVITVDDRIRTELRSGAPAWQFQLAFNPDRASDYQQAARDMIRENHPELTDSALFATSSESTDFQSSLEMFNERVDEFSIWIDRNSDRIRRLVVESELDESELADLAEGQDSQPEGITAATITFDVGLSAYNQSVTVEAPANAQPLESIFGGGMMMQQAPGGSSAGSPITN
jgi:hypothetical protein